MLTRAGSKMCSPSRPSIATMAKSNGIVEVLPATGIAAEKILHGLINEYLQAA
jgi:hypothetical protein